MSSRYVHIFDSMCTLRRTSYAVTFCSGTELNSAAAKGSCRDKVGCHDKVGCGNKGGYHRKGGGCGRGSCGSPGEVVAVGLVVGA